MSPTPPRPPFRFVEVRLTNQPGERRGLLQALQAFARDNQIPDKSLQAADLALEEHLTNVTNYAYEDGGKHDVLVRLELTGDTFLIQVEDDGKPFNPVTQPEPDLTIPLMQRPIGGLGIHLIRHFIDEMDYRRVGNKNVFQMRKRLPRSQSEAS